jgi:hypothetical protein
MTDHASEGNAAQYKSVLPPRTIEPTHKVLKRIDEKLSHLIVALIDPLAILPPGAEEALNYAMLVLPEQAEALSHYTRRVQTQRWSDRKMLQSVGHECQTHIMHLEALGVTKFLCRDEVIALLKEKGIKSQFRDSDD